MEEDIKIILIIEFHCHTDSIIHYIALIYLPRIPKENDKIIKKRKEKKQSRKE